jgi:FAD:protein FMN transferase
MTSTASQPTHRRVEHIMGMPISLALRGPAAVSVDADAAWDRLVAELQEVDRVFSTWKSDSIVSRLGRGDIEISDCPPEVLEVLDLGEKARVDSGGAFDVRRDGSLDPSGVVKGWAVQRAARHLDELAATDYCLNAGGDLTCRSVSGKTWTIGIENPRDQMQLVAVTKIGNGAVATSGLAHRGAHISDPRSARTPGELLSATVIADDLTSADIDATAAFVMGLDALDWLRARHRSGVLVTADGTCLPFGGRDAA